MKIAVSGTQCVGKTTTLELIKKTFNKSGESKQFPLLKGHKIGGSNTDVSSYKLPSSEESNNLTQTIILSNFIKDSFIENLISDRCILDNMVYTELQYLENKCSESLYNLTKEIYNELIHKYDLIFYFPPEIDIIDNGIRSLSPHYRNKLHKIFLGYIDSLNNVYIINGEPELKLLKIRNIISNVSPF
jgi:thymidylate kinase